MGIVLHPSINADLQLGELECGSKRVLARVDVFDHDGLHTTAITLGRNRRGSDQLSVVEHLQDASSPYPQM